MEFTGPADDEVVFEDSEPAVEEELEVEVQPVEIKIIKMAEAIKVLLIRFLQFNAIIKKLLLFFRIPYSYEKAISTSFCNT